MNPFVWLQSLITFRKNGGGFAVPELDAAGRIRVNMLDGTPLVVGTTPPTVTDGTELWLNTNAGLEGLYFRDQTRAKWLEVAMTTLPYGLDNADGSQLRPAGINVPSAGSGYLVPQNVTIIGVTAHSTGGLATKGFNVRLNTVTQFSFNLVANNYSNFNQNTDIAGGASTALDVFAQSAGVAATDVNVVLYLRRRAS